MKKYLFIIFSLVILILFAIFEISNKTYFDVVEIKEPDIIAIDFNHNKTPDSNEYICINNIKSYHKDFNKIETIGLWYLANFYAEKTLTGKKVKVKISNKTTPECLYGDIFVDNQNYADLLTKNNFNINKLDKTKLYKQKTTANKLNLVIYNHRSNIYHKLTCEYGKIAHDAVILPFSQINKASKPCKFCHLENNKTKGHKQKITKTFPLSITDGNLKLILSDFTLKLKPDNNCESLMCKALLSEINNSHKSIDMAIYDFSNNKTILTAIKMAKNRGVKIRVVYDITPKGISKYAKDTARLLDIVELENAKSDLNKNKTITSILMHNKFAIFDNKRVFTGSMNFSKTGLSGFNNNNILIINSKDIAEIYSKEFNQMFNGKFHYDKKIKTNNKNNNIRIYFSPQDKTITTQIIPLIKKAKKYIYIPTFVLTHDEFAKELLNAQSRGVDVKIIIDATNTSAKRSKIKYLRDNGIKIKTENYAGKMHSKAMIIDDEYLILGSMNFSKSGENKNDENCVILRNSKLAKFYSEYFIYIWTKIPNSYLKHNVSAEGKYSIGSCIDGVDNDFDGKIDIQDEGCKN